MCSNEDDLTAGLGKIIHANTMIKTIMERGQGVDALTVSVLLFYIRTIPLRRRTIGSFCKTWSDCTSTRKLRVSKLKTM